MSRKTLLGAVLAVALMTPGTGCFNTAYQTRRPPGQSFEQWNSFFILGLAGEAAVDARGMCPNGVSLVRTYTSVGQVVLTVLTIGLYSPRMVRVTCAAGGPGIAPAGPPADAPTGPPPPPTGPGGGQ